MEMPGWRWMLLGGQRLETWLRTDRSRGPARRPLWHELFCVLPKALEKFDQHGPFLGAQRFSDVFHDRRVLPKCFVDQLLTRCSEADYTVSPAGRMRVTPD
jgi:hypothetical protein